jgi:hypothetical protein
LDWYFRDISDDPSEKELTQQDQFNNDEVVLAEALVRETIQNSTDARLSETVPVRVRFTIGTADTSGSQRFFATLLEGLSPHLDACDIPVPSVSDPARFLTIEDFGTTGLKGAVGSKDDGQFCGFWRRFGRSNKKGSSGGRWGLGKLVFSSSSSIKTVIGLTRRAETPAVCLMGQAILRNHEIDGVETDSVGFWCVKQGSKNGLPSTDATLCGKLVASTGLSRTEETGLSIVVPYVLPDIEPRHLISATLKNYYFPILTGRLAVTVNETIIDAATFDQVSTALGGDSISPSALAFVRELQSLRGTAPHLVLPKSWQVAPITGDLLGIELSTSLRERYKAGEMLYIRAPLAVRLKKGGDGARDTYIDLFLKPSQAGERSQTLVVRGAITVPTEGKKAHLTDCHAAVVADDALISQLLGDAENPAHTQWNERAEKLRANWTGAHLVLRKVRSVLQEIFALVADRIDRDDPMALVDFFSIPKPQPTRGSNKGSSFRPKDLPPPRPKPFRIERRAGGFSIVPNAEMTPEIFPLKIHLRCAYDVLNGNPFRRFSDDDFSFYKEGLKIQKTNADCWPTDPNEIDVEARSSEFKVDVVGFDPNRDLIVEAQS